MAPILCLKLERAPQPWQRLTHGKIVEHLAVAQSHMGTMVICAGCGRILEREFMHLDHINPMAQGGAIHPHRVDGREQEGWMDARRSARKARLE